MLKNHYSILDNHNERFDVKHNLKLSKLLKAKLLYLGGNEFIRRKIDECWNELIAKDEVANQINNNEDWDFITENLRNRGVGYFRNIEEKMK